MNESSFWVVVHTRWRGCYHTPTNCRSGSKEFANRQWRKAPQGACCHLRQMVCSSMEVIRGGPLVDAHRSHQKSLSNITSLWYKLFNIKKNVRHGCQELGKKMLPQIRQRLFKVPQISTKNASQPLVSTATNERSDGTKPQIPCLMFFD